jgi:hypothetical protein
VLGLEHTLSSLKERKSSVSLRLRGVHTAFPIILARWVWPGLHQHLRRHEEAGSLGSRSRPGFLKGHPIKSMFVDAVMGPALQLASPNTVPYSPTADKLEEEVRSIGLERR